MNQTETKVDCPYCIVESFATGRKRFVKMNREDWMYHVVTKHNIAPRVASKMHKGREQCDRIIRSDISNVDPSDLPFRKITT